MKRLIVITIALMLMLLTACSKSEPTTYPIVDKYEHDGKCYVAIEVEITPENYIGYDIGDEYRTN